MTQERRRTWYILCRYIEIYLCLIFSVIEKITEDPNQFYRYANKYKIDKNGIGVLKDRDFFADNVHARSEVLQKQYSSVWSKPNTGYWVDNMEAVFGECTQCKNEMTHICKFDTGICAIEEFGEYILRISDSNPRIKKYKQPKFSLLQ